MVKPYSPSIIYLFACLALLSACSKAPQGGHAMETRIVENGAKSKTLAYQHQLTLEAEASAIPALIAQLQARCQASAEAGCVMLESQQNLTRSASADLKFRAPPAVTQELIDTAGKLATLLERRSTAEELHGPLQDTQKQSDLLLDYRQRLEGLRERAKNDVDALIKVHKELAQVQQDLEQVQGRYQHLQSRVQTELLSLHIQSSEQTNILAPVRRALAEFAQNLAQGSAAVITALAYLLPWIVCLLAGFIPLRKFWRWRKQKRQANV